MQFTLLSSDFSKARAAAIAEVRKRIGARPALADFGHLVHTNADYPAWFKNTILGMAALLIAVAFLPSAFHVESAASDAYLIGVPVPWQAHTVGVSFVFLAEIATVLFGMSSAVLAYVPVLSRVSNGASWLSAAIAIVFNVSAAIPFDATKSLDWLWQLVDAMLSNPALALMALYPPIATLGGGMLLKAVIMDTLRRRMVVHNAYSDALSLWQQQFDTPTLYSEFDTLYADAVSDRLWSKYARQPEFKQQYASVGNRRALALHLIEESRGAVSPDDVQVFGPAQVAVPIVSRPNGR